MSDTISFSTRSKGWSSFFDFQPDWMIGLNSSLYTWKNGDLYKHNVPGTMNKFYGETYPSTLNTVFNDNPTDSKMFKTICIEGDEAWGVKVLADEKFAGEISVSDFKEKEGAFYGHIRRRSGDLDPSLLSTQGVGEVSTFVVDTLVMSNNFTSVSVGDKIYILNGDNFDLIGTVTAYSTNTITVGSVTNTPAPSDFIVTAKNSVAESYGARGGYMEVYLSSTSETKVELFSISSEIFKSYH